MVVDIPHAVNVLHVPQIATGVDDYGNGLKTLGTAQAAGDPGRKPVCTQIAGPHSDGLGEIETADLSEPFRKIECLRQHYRVKCHRKPWRCPHNPIETTKYITAAAAQCPVFELEIDSVVV